MKFCITGATGFIGRELVERLSVENHQVAILTRKNTLGFPENVEIFVGDLIQSDCPLNLFLQDCDILFHCAGETTNSNVMKAVNVDGTKILITAALNECSQTNRKMHWVQLSSCRVYGPPVGKIQSDRTVTEMTHTRPNDEYEMTKTISDNILIDACKDNETLSYSILRPSNVVGAKMKKSTLHRFFGLMKSGLSFYVGKPGAIATYVHVYDVVNALILLSKDQRAVSQIYNLSNDCTMEAFIGGIATKYEFSQPKIRLPIELIRVPNEMLNIMFGKYIKIPQVTALARRTKYPTSKIETELNFSFVKPILENITDIFH